LHTAIEAYLMMDAILKRMSKECPGTPAITIFDSILTNMPEAIQPILRILIEELTKFVGYQPRIGIDNYSMNLK
jgi:hypothetical protein